MRYEGTRPSGTDPQVPVYRFTMEKDEMLLLRDLLADVLRRTPKAIDTARFRGRAQNMRNELLRACKASTLVE